MIQQAYAYVSIKSVFFPFVYQIIRIYKQTCKQWHYLQQRPEMRRNEWGNFVITEDSVLRISNRY